MICAYLLHNHHFKDSKDALKYYGDARTRNAKGVTIPSQRRYVLYYNHVLRHGLEYTRTMVLLKRFEMLSQSMFHTSTLSEYFAVLVIIQRRKQLFMNAMYIVWFSGPHGFCIQLWTEWSRFESWLGAVWCVLNFSKTLYTYSPSLYQSV